MRCRVDDGVCRQYGYCLSIGRVQGQAILEARHRPERVDLPWNGWGTKQGQIGPGLEPFQPCRRPVKGMFAPQPEHQRIGIGNHACRACCACLMYRYLTCLGLRISQLLQRCQRRFSGNDFGIVARAFPNGYATQTCTERLGQGRLSCRFDAGDSDADNGRCVHRCGMKLNHPSRASRV